MVRARLIEFWRDERGISFTEAMLIVPILLIIITGMVEGGVAVFQWNQATKAVQVGARLAAVSSPIVGDTAYQTLASDWTPLGEGDPVNGTVISVACGPGSAACDTARLARLVTGGDNLCDPTATTLGGIVGMCDVSGLIRSENVHITYYRSGLGYIGRPGGTVSSITVELRNLSFDFLILDDLIPGIGTFTIPAQPVSIVSEDLCDQDGTC